MERVIITEAADKVVAQVRQRHPHLIFHLSGGCCDGSSPMLLEAEDMYLDGSDVLLGKVSGLDFYMNRDQFEYWRHTHLTVDVTPGRGSSFSLEIPLGLRFIIHSRMLTPEEESHFNGSEA